MSDHYGMSDRKDYEECEESEHAPMEEVPTHPALKDYSRTAEQAKHVVGKTVKWVATGAAVGGAALGVATLVFAASNPVGWALTAGNIALTAVGMSSVMGPLATAITGGAVAGGALGLLAGVGSGVAGAGDAADERADQLVSDYERGEMRQQRLTDMEHRRRMQVLAMRRQEMEYGINPNAGLPQRGAERGLIT